jgi:hypothetical protein
MRKIWPVLAGAGWWQNLGDKNPDGILEVEDSEGSTEAALF